MKKILKQISIGLVILFGAGIIMAGAGGVVIAAPGDNTEEVCKGIEATGGTCEDDGILDKVIMNIVNIFSWVVGVVAVIMVIWGGFSYVTSAGDPQKAAKGRMTIVYALVGLIIVALAQVIVKFVLNKITTTPS